NWDTPQKICVILAHPDDPEFFCGASIAKWIKSGHRVSYCLLTCGDKGTKDRNISNQELCTIRQREQINAAKILGVTDVHFLNNPDGYLVADLELRKQVARVIRQLKPDIVVTCDPQNLFMGEDRINHPDHRAAGQAVIDAVFPAARDHLYFPELLTDENLEPHVVKELWVSLPANPNVALDVTMYWDIKIQAILQHKSQIADAQELITRMKKRFAEGSTLENPQYIEYFRKVRLQS
ncbi:MAG: PIG-L deacetylase family protein, partial [Anaerolineales bacterium]